MGQSYKDLVVWQKAIDLTESVYQLTTRFPESERYGLTNQMRRASVSIASNIAEGYGHSSKGDFHRFLSHARGSCTELETQIIIARRLSFGEKIKLETSEGLCADVGRLLNALMKSIRPKIS